MKPNDPLAKLLRAAARAERMTQAEASDLPFALEAKVIAALRPGLEPFPFLSLFRRALACAAALALISCGLLLQRNETPDPYEYTLNYSLATAYLQ